MNIKHIVISGKGFKVNQSNDLKLILTNEKLENSYYTFEFDQSMWQYYSTPNTKIPNDQGAFADFLYGDMPSCRGGDDIACVKDNFRYTLY